MTTSRTVEPAPTRARIIAVAAHLLAEGGREAISALAVSHAAGVQPPTVYRIFGDKQGLLNAVAVHGYMTYLDENSDLTSSADPVEDIRHGWDVHIEFGLAHPQIYSLIYGQPDPGVTSPAVAAVATVIRRLMQRIDDAGHLKVSVDLAVLLASAAGSGTVLTLLALPDERRDRALSNDAREAMIASILKTPPPGMDGGPVGVAVALRALLPETVGLTSRESDLMGEWLGRIADAPSW